MDLLKAAADVARLRAEIATDLAGGPTWKRLIHPLIACWWRFAFKIPSYHRAKAAGWNYFEWLIQPGRYWMKVIAPYYAAYYVRRIFVGRAGVERWLDDDDDLDP